MTARNDALLFAALAFTCAFAGLASLSFGETALPFTDWLAALTGQGEDAHQIIVWQIRAPRALAAFITGAALGLSGAALQGLLRNPLADPGVLGVSASASLGATIVIYFGFVQVWAWALPLAAVAGALMATLLLSFAALASSSVVGLILIGVGLSSLAGALMSLVVNFAPNPFSLSDMMNWMLGSVANRSLRDSALALPFVLAGAALLIASARGLQALSLGEEAASGVGLNLARTRLLTVAGAGLATGGAVSLAGAIGFVGLIAPHFIRPLVGHDPARALWPSALFAGLMLLLADILVRLLPSQTELKLGVVVALIGAPAFIWIAARRRTDHG